MSQPTVCPSKPLVYGMSITVPGASGRFGDHGADKKPVVKPSPKHMNVPPEREKADG